MAPWLDVVVSLGHRLRPASKVLLLLLGLLLSLAASAEESSNHELRRRLSDAGLGTPSANVIRALPNSPSGGYAPAKAACPATPPSIRGAASGLSQSETAWLQKRRLAVYDPMVDFFNRADISMDSNGSTAFDARQYLQGILQGGAGNNIPTIAMAISGGGYRAMLTGGGVLAAADSRTAGATARGGLGGLMQATTYLSALSGGAWMLSSVFANNFTSVEALRDSGNVWSLSSNVFEGPLGENDTNVLSKAADITKYWEQMAAAVTAKEAAGFDTTITDYWGRALSYQLVDAPEGGPAYTFSSIALTDGFDDASTPFPIVVADARSPGQALVSENSTVFEFNPYEMGTFDLDVYAFVPTEYLGTKFYDGAVTDAGECVRGFDQIGFIAGTSSSLFNAILTANVTTYAANNTALELALPVIQDILQPLDVSEQDLARFNPNPFYGWRPDVNPSGASSVLYMCDGGEDNENIPFHPLLQPARAVDVIFAVDSSADTAEQWPDGSSLVATYQRSQNAYLANGTLFPAVPDVATQASLGLTTRPVFYGCDASNSSSPSPPPLVVYMPNAFYSGAGNQSTFEMTYSDALRDEVLLNGLNMATQNNGTLDADWPACVACAALARSFARERATVPWTCKVCFNRYCWDGKTTPG